MTQRTLYCALLALGVATLSTTHAADASKSTPGREWPSVVVTPAIDVPMRDAAITRAPDGVYYLTGTLGPDFENSRQIKLWKSRDLKEWEEIGVVWDQDLDVFGERAKYPESQWMSQSHKDPSSVDSPVVHGLKSPELHHIKGDWFLCFSINDQGTGLLKSTSGKPEGPYEPHAQITLRHGDPSMFWDVKDEWGGDGSVYWLFGGGWIAKMNDDLTALVEQPRQLATTHESPPDWAVEKGAKVFRDHPLTVGDHGVFLFKNRGRYFWTAAERTNRLNASCDDTFIAWSDTLMGPYSPRQLMVPHGGGITVFRGPRSSAVPKYHYPQQAFYLRSVSKHAKPPGEIAKAWNDDTLYATFSGNDVRAIFRDRPSFLPLEWAGPDRWEPEWFGDLESFPRKPQGVITERGPWPWMRPLIEGNTIRDLKVTPAPNGKYYLGGSAMSHPGKLVLWESDDLATWKLIGPFWTYEQIEWLPKKLPYPKLPEGGVDWQHIFWHTWVTWWNDTFYITYCIFKPADGSLDTHMGVGALRSTTGRIEGPYESLGRVGGQYGQAPEASLFSFFSMKGELYAGDWVNWRQVVAKVDARQLSTPGWPFEWKRVEVGVFAKMFRGDTYGVTEVEDVPLFYFMSDGRHDNRESKNTNTYTHHYLAMETPWGPIRPGAKPQAVPHNGAANLFKDHKGYWWSGYFGDDHSAPWWEQFGLIPLRVEKLGADDIRIDVEGNPDDYQKRIMGGGQIAEVRTVLETLP
jgi:hypothetical protein